jgi:hypothetical protein
MEELRRSIPRYRRTWPLGRYRLAAKSALESSWISWLLSGCSQKTFSVPRHRQECLCYLTEIFEMSGNFFRHDLVYTGKTTRGVGG